MSQQPSENEQVNTMPLSEQDESTSLGDDQPQSNASQKDPHQTAASQEEQLQTAAPQDGQTPPKTQGISNADKIKFVGLIAFILLIVVVGFQLLPYFSGLSTAEGRLELVQSIREAGALGVLICFGLQFVQIVVAFIPGEVTQLAIGAIYGPVWGTTIIITSALISSVFVFFVVRQLGSPFVEAMVGSKDSKILSFLDKGRRLNVIVFILFLIPGLPKDVFTYLVPLTHIRPANFFILSTIGRIPGVAASAFVGSAAVQGDYTQAIIVGIIAGGLGLLGILFNQKIIGVVDKIEDRLKHHKTA